MVKKNYNDKYLRRTINLGKVGHKARIIAETYIEKHGKKKFSELIRRLLVENYEVNPAFDKIKSEIKVKEFILLKKKIARLLEKKSYLEDFFKNKGVDVDAAVLYYNEKEEMEGGV